MVGFLTERDAWATIALTIMSETRSDRQLRHTGKVVLLPLSSSIMQSPMPAAAGSYGRAAMSIPTSAACSSATFRDFFYLGVVEICSHGQRLLRSRGVAYIAHVEFCASQWQERSRDRCRGQLRAKHDGQRYMGQVPVMRIKIGQLSAGFGEARH